jgi:hypothetical protein
LCEESGAAVALDTPHIGVSSTSRADRTIDYLELQVRVTLKQANLEIHRLSGVEEKHSMPLDVKDAVRCAALDSGEDTAAVCPGGAARVGCNSHQVLPHTEDGEVIRPNIRRRRQTT